MPAVLPPVSSDAVSEQASGHVPEVLKGDRPDTLPDGLATPRPAAPSSPPAPPAAALPFQTGSIQADRFQPAPLPAEWVQTGNPAPRSLPLTRSADGQLSSGLWACTAGSFTYIFPCDEIVHILEGDVIVESQGERQHLRVGDVAFFPQGLATQWTVRHHVKKLAIFRVVTRPLHTRIAARLGRWLGSMR